ncbi:sensor histidine kinase [Ilumatobacter nonamiensis]|uniref:sensor histidine kinase n=1 Tax=Ilumatobacter nonamiensis TaxID=467093 RepID=UPI0011D28BA0|nr:HAMP domain-containing sensor histidine kinase [Ilumatobacter nonamiensis]
MVGPIRRLIGRSRPRSIGLRRRILVIITLGSIALSVFVATTTFGLTRSNLVSERDEAAISTSRRNALGVERDLRPTFPPEPTAARASLERIGVQRYMLWYRDTQYGRPPFTRDNLPPELFEKVVVDEVSASQVVRIDDELNIVVGWSVPDVGAYFEFFALDDVESNLSNLRVALFLAALITTGLGVLVGVFAARRAVKPLGTAAQAASAIAGGRLDTRLENNEDPDLRVLTESFNDMAQALELRVERDARFASDVSHELRSPLMTLAASVEVMEARRDDLPERAQSALDLLSGDVVRFQGLVEDLLEISRFDAGAIRLNMEELLAAEFVRQAVAVSSVPETPVRVSERAELAIIRGDKRRLARVIANLIDNARAYGGGEPEITIEVTNPPDEPMSHLTIAVEDRGAGVAPEERSLIFERFARGGGAGRRTGSEGAGLGLSLVDEHVRMHGGRVWVEDRLDGESGARFVIELMATELED